MAHDSIRALPPVDVNIYHGIEVTLGTVSVIYCWVTNNSKTWWFKTTAIYLTPELVVLPDLISAWFAQVDVVSWRVSWQAVWSNRRSLRWFGSPLLWWSLILIGSK